MYLFNWMFSSNKKCQKDKYLIDFFLSRFLSETVESSHIFSIYSLSRSRTRYRCDSTQCIEIVNHDSLQ